MEYHILIFPESCDIYPHICPFMVVAPNFNPAHPQASRNWEESLGIKNEPAQNGQGRTGRSSRMENMKKTWKKTSENGKS